jgi:hypothetical protein
MRKIFLACPYGHADKLVVEQRFEQSNKVAAQIVRAGAIVFSQVSMSHPINQHLTELDKNGISKLWAPIDQVFMEAMDELVVIDEPGWKESAGVAREIEFFRSRNRRVSLWSEVQGEFSA